MKILCLSIPDRVFERIQSLTIDSGSKSESELLQRALALYDLAMEHKQGGGKLIFEHKDGEQEKLDFK